MPNRKTIIPGILVILIAFLLVCASCSSQNGCTDPSASNYNSSSRYDDSTCNYREISLAPDSFAELKSKYNENSGLEYFTNRIWTFNDGGGETKIYSIDTTDGGEQENIFLKKTINIDWEDIAKDVNYVYVGDFGNNTGNRTDLKIYKFPLLVDSNINNNNNTAASEISFTYPDQKDFRKNDFNNYDCEAMISTDDWLFIFTKRHGDKRTAAYRIPKSPGQYVAELMGYFQVHGLVTGADLSDEGDCLALTMYKESDNNNYIWLFKKFPGDHFFEGQKSLIKLGSRDKFGQIEGICFKNREQIYISGELYQNTSPCLWKLNIRNL